MSRFNHHRTTVSPKPALEYDELPSKEARSYDQITVYNVYTTSEMIRERARYLLVASLPFYVSLGVVLALALESKEIALAYFLMVPLVYGYYFKRQQRKADKPDQERQSTREEIDEV